MVVKSIIYPDKKIELITGWEGTDSFVTAYRSIIDTQDKVVIESLKKLGWTPPKEVKKGIKTV